MREITFRIPFREQSRWIPLIAALSVAGCGQSQNASERTPIEAKKLAAPAPAAAAQQKEPQRRELSPIDRPPPEAPRPLDASQLLQQVEQAVVRLDVKTKDGSAIGSGFVADAAGLVVTNYHVIEGATSVRLSFKDRGVATVSGALAVNPHKDIAVLKAEFPKARPALPIAGQLPRLGENVFTFGTPQGLSFTVSKGIVSALRTSAEMTDLLGPEARHPEYNLIQTDASISPGNSGGPLANEQGAVVGINTFHRVGGQNLNFAVSCLDVQTEVASARRAVLKPFPLDLPPRRKPVDGSEPEEGAEIAGGGGIKEGFRRYVERWKRQQRSVVEGLQKQLETIEGDIRASENVMAVVKEGGKDSIEVMKQFDYGKTRGAWLRAARAYVATQQEKLVALREEIDFQKACLDDELYPLPVLNPHQLQVGDFGAVLGAVRISQILDGNSFIGYWEDVQIHFHKFDVASFGDDEHARLKPLVMVSGRYRFATVIGAKRTILSIEPMDLQLLPEELEEKRKRRQQLVDARDGRRETLWREQIAKAEKAIELKIGFPQLGTRHEPETIMDVLKDGVATPRFAKTYRTETFEQVVQRQPPSSPVVLIHTRTVETEESKARRAELIREFNAKKSVYPSIMLSSLIDALDRRSTDEELCAKQREQLRTDARKLEELVFRRFGLRPSKETVLPWNEKQKAEVADHLQAIAIRHGRLDRDALLQLAVKEGQSKPEAANVSIERLKEQLRLKHIALEREKKNVAKVDRTTQAKLESDIAQLKKQIAEAQSDD